ncbi:hypothetical protein GOBAR_DD12679 [Gossypium barbadense]|nr:hypothetical protein GOBAR_DD12679 [Gossypium barbadense]
MNSGNFEGVKAHYNPAFKGPEGVKVPMTDGVLDPRKYFAQGISVKRSMETLGAGTLGPKDGKNSGKNNISHGGQKPSNTLRGWESRFKFSGNFRIPLAESIKAEVELLSFQASSEAAKMPMK